MTEPRNITEGEARVEHLYWSRKTGITGRDDLFRAALEVMGITVVPDPTPPLPTEPNTLWLGADNRLWEIWGDGTIHCVESRKAKAADHAPFTRLYTRAESIEQAR